MKRNFLIWFKDRLEKEHQQMANSRGEIDSDNSRSLHMSVSIFMGLMVLMLLISFTRASFQPYQPLYLAAFLLTLLLHFLSRRRISHRRILASFYVLCAIVFAFAVCLGVVFAQNQMSSSIIAFFLLAPLLLIDKFWRINLVMLCFYVVFVFSVLLFKPTVLALYDAVNVGAFFLVGIIVGEYLKGIKLSNIESRRLLTIQSYTDELTGLYNRRKLYEDIAESNLSDAASPVTGVIMIDLDFFKQYNDSYGHQQGDVCLELLGKAFLAIHDKLHLRIYRYGGEEFLALYYGDPSRLRKTAESLQQAAAELHIPFSASPFTVVTISVGFAAANQQTAACEELIRKADEALYRAKDVGRNTLCGDEGSAVQNTLPHL